MSGISFGQLVAANFWLIVISVALLVVVAVVILVRRRRRVRRLPAVVDGVRFECQDVRVDDDLIVERDWRVTFLLSNVTKRPVMVPVISSRGALRVGRVRYAGAVFVERAVAELNPGEHLVVWLMGRLPAGEVPGRGTISVGRDVGELELTFGSGHRRFGSRQT